MDNKSPKFLADTPLEYDKELSLVFGHGSISDNLAKIVLSCPRPFTIALFGKWGTGKTTILQWLESRLKKESNAPLIAHIDAWKYEGDSLRRQFLITLDEELGLKKNYKKVLNQSLSESDPFKGEIKFDKALFFNRIGVITIIIASLGFVLKLLSSHPDVPFLSKFSVSFDLIFNLGLAAYLIQFTVSFFQRVSITTTEPRTDSAEGFDRIFQEEILGHDKIKGKSLLIIIDNLDRCGDSKVVEMLSTIKTFLISDRKPNNCIFLIACDDEAIRKHIESVYSKDGDEYDSDEFLRKFFNAFLRIPPFIDTELQSYTDKLLADTNVKEFQNDDVAYIITVSFRDNPRQIKQFINTLLAHFLLAKEREDNEEINVKGSVTGHVAVLAKTLILKQKSPKAYECLLKEHKTVEELRDVFPKDKNLLEFLDMTRTIRAKNIRPFIFLKQSDEERKIPGIQELELALVGRKDDVAVTLIKKIHADTGQFSHLKRWLPDFLERNKKNTNKLRNSIETVLKAFNSLKIVLTSGFYNKIALFLYQQDILFQNLTAFDPSLIFEEVIPNCDSQYRDSILSHYVEIFALGVQNSEGKDVSMGFLVQLFTQFLLHKDKMKSKLGGIRKAISERYSSEVEILNLLKDNIENQKDFLEEEAIQKLISSLSGKAEVDIESNVKKLMLISNFYSRVESSGSTVIEALLKSLHQIITNLNKLPYDDKKIALIEEIANALKGYEPLIVDGIDTKAQHGFFREVSQLIDVSVQGFSSVGKIPQKAGFVSLLLTLSRIDKNKKPTIDQLLQEFFTGVQLPILESLIKNSDESDVAEILANFKNVLYQRIQQDGKVLKLLYPIAESGIRTQWLIKLIGSPHYPTALSFLEENDYKVDDNQEILKSLLTQAGILNPPERNKVYVAINSISWKGCVELKDTYVAQIKKLLIQPTQSLQSAGLEALEGAKKIFTDSNKREIARSTIDWLSTLDTSNAVQKSAIGSVFLCWEAINDQEAARSKFIDFLFYKLIIESNSIDTISFGFGQLQNVVPPITKKQYSSFFEDIEERIKKESNEKLISVLKEGIQSFKAS